eukprot:1594187-Rhodomonas_salina.2
MARGGFQYEILGSDLNPMHVKGRVAFPLLAYAFAMPSPARDGGRDFIMLAEVASPLPSYGFATECPVLMLVMLLLGRGPGQ